jgi:hypothetical protein
LKSYRWREGCGLGVETAGVRCGRTARRRRPCLRGWRSARGPSCRARRAFRSNKREHQENPQRIRDPPDVVALRRAEYSPSQWINVARPTSVCLGVRRRRRVLAASPRDHERRSAPCTSSTIAVRTAGRSGTSKSRRELPNGSEPDNVQIQNRNAHSRINTSATSSTVSSVGSREDVAILDGLHFQFQRECEVTLNRTPSPQRPRTSRSFPIRSDVTGPMASRSDEALRADA